MADPFEAAHSVSQVVAGAESANQARIFKLMQDASGMLSAASECVAELRRTACEGAAVIAAGQMLQDCECELEQTVAPPLCGCSPDGSGEGTGGF
ncbi:hypothetical protein [Gemmata massiliana]|uniref:hypothetical protein n=1 Tax=Gemmata massiliana TaxID=1210884 RepID=UPI0013A6DE91|nr:hypothetical protein [Gemmata massiliana]